MTIKEASKRRDQCLEKVNEWNEKYNKAQRTLYKARGLLEARIETLFALKNIEVEVSNHLTITHNHETIVEHYANHTVYQNISKELYERIIALYEEECGEPTERWSEKSIKPFAY